MMVLVDTGGHYQGLTVWSFPVSPPLSFPVQGGIYAVSGFLYDLFYMPGPIMQCLFRHEPVLQPLCCDTAVLVGLYCPVSLVSW